MTHTPAPIKYVQRGTRLPHLSIMNRDDVYAGISTAADRKAATNSSVPNDDVLSDSP